MNIYYPLLSLFSIVVFGVLGHRMASERNRNAVGWGLLGALLPPLLLILWRLRTLPEEAAEP